MEANYREEIEGVKDHHEATVRELDQVYQELFDRERQLNDEIKDEAHKLQEMERKHQEILEELQNKLNSTLNN